MKTVIARARINEAGIVEELRIFSTLKGMCAKTEDFSYHYLKGQKLPQKYKGYLIFRVNVER